MASRFRTTAGLLALSVAISACSVGDDVEVRLAAPIEERWAAELGSEPLTVPPVVAVPPAQTTTPSTAAPTSTAPPTAPDAPDTSLPPVSATDGDPDTPQPISQHELFVTVGIDEVVDIGVTKPGRAHDAFVAVAFSDIERWWAEAFPTIYGEAFTPLSGGIFAGYPERTTPIPGCSEPETEYAELRLYVAFYCNVGDFMAYDDGADPDPLTGSLLTPLADQFGPAVVGVVLAHEYGHVIQERVGVLDRPLATIVTEQQADCFAGAWTGQAYRGESPMLRLGDADVRAGLLAMLEVRDPVGTNQFQAGGHGSAFDRVGAFQVGFTQGAARCAELIDEPLPLMPNAFRTVEDLDRNGNASYDCSDDPSPECRPAPEFLAQDLNHFWSVTFDGAWQDFSVSAVPSLDVTAIEASCDRAVVLTGQVVVCPSTRVVIYDEPALRSLYDEFGDFTLGFFYGIASGELVQRDVDSGLVGEARALLNDCLTGAWVRDITPDDLGQTPRSADLDGDGEPDSTVTSSPGDLDEAIRMAILIGDLGANVDVVGSAFEKIEAFRTGVLGGLDACGIS